MTHNNNNTSDFNNQYSTNDLNSSLVLSASTTINVLKEDDKNPGLLQTEQITIVEDVQMNRSKTSENNTSLDELKVQSNQTEKKKKRRRRGKKRRHHVFNPYRLSNTEYERKECERLQRNRDKMVKQGKTLAPFNTTQFIMAEHCDDIPNFDSVNSSDMDSVTTTEDNYLNEEFNKEYEIVKLDYYKSLSKTELLNECFQIFSELNKLQDTVTKLEQENYRLKEKLTQYDQSSSSTSSSSLSTTSLQSQSQLQSKPPEIEVNYLPEEQLVD